MLKEFPAEFKRDVVSVARQGERSKVRVAKDFGVSEACLYRWLKEDAVESGTAAGMTKEDSVRFWLCGSGTSSWNRRTRSCVGPRRISPGMSSRNDVPAGS
jgi:transposase-like protein